jgi:uncharacterized membrane protein YphA (DoxX/SURF4 family)
MRWLALAARVLVGGGFVFAALMYFLGTMPAQPDLPEPAKQLGGVLGSSGWMTVVKVLELVGGVLVLSGRLAPVGLVLVTPVAVNIALWDVCLLGKPGPGVILTVLCFLLVGYYWRHFAGVFAPAKWV